MTYKGLDWLDSLANFGKVSIHKAKICNVLTSSDLSRINFKISNVIVNKEQLGKVADAIRNSSLEVEIEESSGNLAAAYTSWRTRKKQKGEVIEKIGKIKVPKNVFDNINGKATVIHECMHALKDIKNYKISMIQDEVVAYITGALYMALHNKRVSQGGENGAIFKEAYNIVISKNMLSANKMVQLEWQDCKKLDQAIRGNSSYNGSYPQNKSGK